jgi:hypothetical protein
MRRLRANDSDSPELESAPSALRRFTCRSPPLTPRATKRWEDDFRKDADPGGTSHERQYVEAARGA